MPGRSIRRPARGPYRGIHVVVAAGFHVLRRGSVTRLVPLLVGDLLVVFGPRGSIPFNLFVILSVAGVLLALRDRQAAVVVVVEPEVVSVFQSVWSDVRGVVVFDDFDSVFKLRHHLVPLLPSPHVRPHVLHRLFGDWFEEVILGAESYAVHDGVRVFVGGHHDHRHLLVERVVAHVV